MLVRILTGPDAGRIEDLPEHAAQHLIDKGAAELGSQEDMRALEQLRRDTETAEPKVTRRRKK